MVVVVVWWWCSGGGLSEREVEGLLDERDERVQVSRNGLQLQPV